MIVFVGCSDKGIDSEAQMVLEYSARKHTTSKLNFVWMHEDKTDPNSIWSGWNKTNWTTSFSSFRWAIPSICNYEGQAIYLDCDTIVLSDLKELWDIPWENDKCVQTVNSHGNSKYSVMKLNNKRLKNIIPHYSTFKNMSDSYFHLCGRISEPQYISDDWNKFDYLFDGKVAKILHYTTMNKQPHLKYAIPRLSKNDIKHPYDEQWIIKDSKDKVQTIFDKYYHEALENGYSVNQYA